MSKPSSFDILDEMSSRNLQSIKAFPLGNIISAQIVGARGKVTIMTDAQTVMDILTNKSITGMLIVADYDEYKKIEGELKERGER